MKLSTIIVSRTTDTLTITCDPTVFDDFDSTEPSLLEINFVDSDFSCEHDDCDDQSLPSISFLDWSPAQSVMTNCLRHYPVMLDFVNKHK